MGYIAKTIGVALLLFGGLSFGAGEIANGEVSTFLRGKLQDTKAVKKALTDNGFEILGMDKVDKKGELITMIFTSPELKKSASSKEKGFAAIMRILINKHDKEISITNPIYFLSAFLQDKYSEKTALSTLKKINKAFPELKDSTDKLKFSDLSDYHFMVGMPYYGDMIKVGSGKEEDLLKKIKGYKHSKNVIFSLELGNGAMLVGYKIGKRTAKFVKKIGTKNASLLPYTILIEGGEAKILDPKYYLALNYPSLSMSEFMTIATIPGAIEKDCSKALK